MTDTLDRSDLIDWAQHEHNHLIKLFSDLHETFEKIASGRLTGDDREEVLDQAVEDLEVALDDMLEHFSEEEEVYFVAIEQRFPEFSEEIGVLVSAHKHLCTQTKWMQRFLARRRSELHEELERLTGVIDELSRTLGAHNDREQRVFERALERLSQDERIEILERKKAL